MLVSIGFSSVGCTEFFYFYCFQGVLNSGFGILVHTWGLHVKGPVYVALFRPLSIAIAAAMGFIFLGDNLYLGRYIPIEHDSQAHTTYLCT